MSVVIVGGNECMECKYKDICKRHGCKAKVFTKMRGNFADQIGSPDLIILFTKTVSHKMAGCAKQAADRFNTTVAHCHSSSSSALEEVLKQYASGN
ncbi:MAG: DUF2325 domain-containing protein [Ruminococcaceae bacterium]|jgi:hypothetical protein|nr:DUF2325 domain-containing protein [Oscillospiraceae bacterium]